MVLGNCFRRSLRIAVASVAMLVLSGCSVIDTAGDKSLPLPAGTELAQTPATTITMEIRASGEKPKITELRLDGDTTVQQALEKAKLVKKFRRMDIQVMRVAGDQRAKLDVKYDHTAAHVKPLYDYSLYPGDHLIVEEVTKTALDDMLESVADPLRRATGSRSERRHQSM
jgi:hypothetical protein